MACLKSFSMSSEDITSLTPILEKLEKMDDLKDLPEMAKLAGKNISLQFREINNNWFVHSYDPRLNDETFIPEKCNSECFSKCIQYVKENVPYAQAGNCYRLHPITKTCIKPLVKQISALLIWQKILANGAVKKNDWFIQWSHVHGQPMMNKKIFYEKNNRLYLCMKSKPQESGKVVSVVDMENPDCSHGFGCKTHLHSAHPVNLDSMIFLAEKSWLDNTTNEEASVVEDVVNHLQGMSWAQLVNEEPIVEKEEPIVENEEPIVENEILNLQLCISTDIEADKEDASAKVKNLQTSLTMLQVGLTMSQGAGEIMAPAMREPLRTVIEQCTDLLALLS